MKKMHFLVLLSFASLNQIAAQVSMGVTAGANLANIHQNYQDVLLDLDTKYKFGLTFGVMLEIPFNEYAGFQTGLVYSNKGFNIDLKKTYTDSTTGYDQHNLHYLQIPLNASISPVKYFHLYLGGYVAVGFSGINKYDLEFGNGNSDRGENIYIPFFGDADETELGNNERAFSAFDMGVNFGLGGDINDFRVTASYSIGLANFIPGSSLDPTFDEDDFFTAHRVFSLTATYILPLSY